MFFTVAFWFLFRIPAVKMWATQNWSRKRLVLQLVCGLLVVLVVGCGLFPVITERIRANEEATILSMVAAYRHGQPLYPAADAPVDYGLLYGPVTYFIYLPPMLAGAVRLQGYEAWSLAALAGSFLFVFLALRPRFGLSAALGNCALLAIFIPRHAVMEWAIKAEPWLLLLSALGFWAACRLPRWTAACVIAISGAMLVDMKATILLVALLPCVLLWQRERSARVPAAICAFLLIPLLAFVPFAFPGVSIGNYLEILLGYQKHPVLLSNLLLNAQMVLLVLLPTLLLLRTAMHVDAQATRAWISKRSVYLGVLIVASIVAMVTGAKTGGGSWHCMVVVIPFLFVNAELWNQIVGRHALTLLRSTRLAAPMLAFGVVVTITALKSLVIAVEQTLYVLPDQTQVSARDTENDLLAISRRYPGKTMQMGYSDYAHYNVTFVRPVLQIQGSPLFLDPITRTEKNLIGEHESPELVDALARCTIQLWVIPKGGAPFSIEDLYYNYLTANHENKTGVDPELYHQSFRQTFLTHYEKIQQPSRYFDVWACRTPIMGSPTLE